MGGIELNIFTNIVHRNPARIPIFQTIESIQRTFGLNSFCGCRIYMHPFPFGEAEAEYREMLHRFCGSLGLNIEIITTTSLWDGYVKSIQVAEAPFLFQMEHDWTFVHKLIKHSAQQITGLMAAEDLPYLRFNRRKNGVITGMTREVEEHKTESFTYCRDNVMSNNPHFIRTAFYKDVALPLLLRNSGQGSLGIERELTAEIGRGSTYGALGYPGTVKHLNGKKIYLKSQMQFSDKIVYRLKRLDRFSKKFLPGLRKKPLES